MLTFCATRFSTLRSLPLRTTQFVQFSSDDKKPPENEKPSENAQENYKKEKKDSAAERLNRLLASMQTNEKLTLVKKVEIPKAGGRQKQKNLAKKEKEVTISPPLVEQKPNDLLEAAKNVANLIGQKSGADEAVKKQVESELLSKLLHGNSSGPDIEPKNVGEMSLSDLIVGMKIDRSSKPIEQQTRSQFVRKVISGRQQQPQRSGDRYQPYKKQLTEAIPHTGSVNLFGGEALGIFKDPSVLQENEDILSTWNDLEKRELKLSITHPPENYFQKMALWTEQGRLWKFPINNEQGLEKEAEVDFSEHIFLEQHLEGWCPTKGPIRHFMELVCVGLSKNHYIRADEKRDHILWYRDYFEKKKDVLKELTKAMNESGQKGAETKSLKNEKSSNLADGATILSGNLKAQQTSYQNYSQTAAKFHSNSTDNKLAPTAEEKSSEGQSNEKRLIFVGHTCIWLPASPAKTGETGHLKSLFSASARQTVETKKTGDLNGQIKRTENSVKNDVIAQQVCAVKPDLDAKIETRKNENAKLSSRQNQNTLKPANKQIPSLDGLKRETSNWKNKIDGSFGIAIPPKMHAALSQNEINEKKLIKIKREVDSKPFSEIADVESQNEQIKQQDLKIFEKRTNRRERSPTALEKSNNLITGKPEVIVAIPEIKKNIFFLGHSCTWLPENTEIPIDFFEKFGVKPKIDVIEVIEKKEISKVPPKSVTSEEKLNNRDKNLSSMRTNLEKGEAIDIKELPTVKQYRKQKSKSFDQNPLGEISNKIVGIGIANRSMPLNFKKLKEEKPVKPVKQNNEANFTFMEHPVKYENGSWILLRNKSSSSQNITNKNDDSKREKVDESVQPKTDNLILESTQKNQGNEGPKNEHKIQVLEHSKLAVKNLVPVMHKGVAANNENAVSFNLPEQPNQKFIFKESFANKVNENDKLTPQSKLTQQPLKKENLERNIHFIGHSCTWLPKETSLSEKPMPITKIEQTKSKIDNFVRRNAFHLNLKKESAISNMDNSKNELRKPLSNKEFDRKDLSKEGFQEVNVISNYKADDNFKMELSKETSIASKENAIYKNSTIQTNVVSLNKKLSKDTKIDTGISLAEKLFNENLINENEIKSLTAADYEFRNWLEVKTAKSRRKVLKKPIKITESIVIFDKILKAIKIMPNEKFASNKNFTQPTVNQIPDPVEDKHSKLQENRSIPSEKRKKNQLISSEQNQISGSLTASVVKLKNDSISGLNAKIENPTNFNLKVVSLLNQPDSKDQQLPTTFDIAMQKIDKLRAARDEIARSDQLAKGNNIEQQNSASKKNGDILKATINNFASISNKSDDLTNKSQIRTEKVLNKNLTQDPNSQTKQYLKKDVANNNANSAGSEDKKPMPKEAPAREIFYKNVAEKTITVSQTHQCSSMENIDNKNASLGDKFKQKKLLNEEINKNSNYQPSNTQNIFSNSEKLKNESKAELPNDTLSTKDSNPNSDKQPKPQDWRKDNLSNNSVVLLVDKNDLPKDRVTRKEMITKTEVEQLKPVSQHFKKENFVNKNNLISLKDETKVELPKETLSNKDGNTNLDDQQNLNKGYVSNSKVTLSAHKSELLKDSVIGKKNNENVADKQPISQQHLKKENVINKNNVIPLKDKPIGEVPKKELASTPINKNADEQPKQQHLKKENLSNNTMTSMGNKVSSELPPDFPISSKEMVKKNVAEELKPVSKQNFNKDNVAIGNIVAFLKDESKPKLSKETFSSKDVNNLYEQPKPKMQQLLNEKNIANKNNVVTSSKKVEQDEKPTNRIISEAPLNKFNIDKHLPEEPKLPIETQPGVSNNVVSLIDEADKPAIVTQTKPKAIRENEIENGFVLIDAKQNPEKSLNFKEKKETSFNEVKNVRNFEQKPFNENEKINASTKIKQAMSSEFKQDNVLKSEKGNKNNVVPSSKKIEKGENLTNRIISEASINKFNIDKHLPEEPKLTIQTQQHLKTGVSNNVASLIDEAIEHTGQSKQINEMPPHKTNVTSKTVASLKNTTNLLKQTEVTQIKPKTIRENDIEKGFLLIDAKQNHEKSLNFNEKKETSCKEAKSVRNFEQKSFNKNEKVNASCEIKQVMSSEFKQDKVFKLEKLNSVVTEVSQILTPAKSNAKKTPGNLEKTDFIMKQSAYAITSIVREKLEETALNMRVLATKPPNPLPPQKIFEVDNISKESFSKITSQKQFVIKKFNTELKQKPKEDLPKNGANEIKISEAKPIYVARSPLERTYNKIDVKLKEIQNQIDSKETINKIPGPKSNSTMKITLSKQQLMELRTARADLEKPTRTKSGIKKDESVKLPRTQNLKPSAEPEKLSHSEAEIKKNVPLKEITKLETVQSLQPVPHDKTYIPFTFKISRSVKDQFESSKEEKTPTSVKNSVVDHYKSYFKESSGPPIKKQITLFQEIKTMIKEDLFSLQEISKPAQELTTAKAHGTSEIKGQKVKSATKEEKPEDKEPDLSVESCASQPSVDGRPFNLFQELKSIIKQELFTQKAVSEIKAPKSKSKLDQNIKPIVPTNHVKVSNEHVKKIEPSSISLTKEKHQTQELTKSEGNSPLSQNKVAVSYISEVGTEKLKDNDILQIKATEIIAPTSNIESPEITSPIKEKPRERPQTLREQIKYLFKVNKSETRAQSIGTDEFLELLDDKQSKLDQNQSPPSSSKQFIEENSIHREREKLLELSIETASTSIKKSEMSPSHKFFDQKSLEFERAKLLTLSKPISTPERELDSSKASKLSELVKLEPKLSLDLDKVNEFKTLPEAPPSPIIEKLNSNFSESKKSSLKLQNQTVLPTKNIEESKPANAKLKVNDEKGGAEIFKPPESLKNEENSPVNSELQTVFSKVKNYFNDSDAKTSTVQRNSPVVSIIDHLTNMNTEQVKFDLNMKLLTESTNLSKLEDLASLELPTRATFGSVENLNKSESENAQRMDPAKSCSTLKHEDKAQNLSQNYLEKEDKRKNLNKNTSDNLPHLKDDTKSIVNFSEAEPFKNDLQKVDMKSSRDNTQNLSRDDFGIDNKSDEFANLNVSDRKPIILLKSKQIEKDLQIVDMKSPRENTQNYSRDDFNKEKKSDEYTHKKPAINFSKSKPIENNLQKVDVKSFPGNTQTFSEDDTNKENKSGQYPDLVVSDKKSIVNFSKSKPVQKDLQKVDIKSPYDNTETLSRDDLNKEEFPSKKENKSGGSSDLNDSDKKSIINFSKLKEMKNSQNIDYETPSTINMEMDRYNSFETSPFSKNQILVKILCSLKLASIKKD